MNIDTYCFSDLKQRCQTKIEEVLEDKIMDCLSQLSIKNSYKFFGQKIANEVIQGLKDLGFGMKYICNVYVLKKNSLVMDSYASCIWNSSTDGSILVKYDKDNRLDFYCYVFAIAP